MIQVNELRVGSFYNYNGNSIKLDGGFLASYLQNDIKPLLQPILLTEEWLLKFGFVENCYQDRFENKFIHVECNKIRGKTELWIENIPHIKYIHQLQNLYFALTGEDLQTTP
jgi:hypothetical protein